MLIHAHSGLRWVVLILLLAAIFVSLMKWQSKAMHKKSDNMLPMLAMAFTHIQVVLGLILYFTSAKVAYRFYGMEHITIMILAVVLLTIGYSRAKRQSDSIPKFKTVFPF